MKLDDDIHEYIAQAVAGVLLALQPYRIGPLNQSNCPYFFQKLLWALQQAHDFTCNDPDCLLSGLFSDPDNETSNPPTPTPMNHHPTQHT